MLKGSPRGHIEALTGKLSAVHADDTRKNLPHGKGMVDADSFVAGACCSAGGMLERDPLQAEAPPISQSHIHAVM